MTECWSSSAAHRLAHNLIGGYFEGMDFISTPEGPKAIADALLANASLTKIDVSANVLGDDGKAALRKAVEGRSGFRLVL